VSHVFLHQLLWMECLGEQRLGQEALPTIKEYDNWFFRYLGDIGETLSSGEFSYRKGKWGPYSGRLTILDKKQMMEQSSGCQDLDPEGGTIFKNHVFLF
jgi:hypothetical protein